MNYKKNKNKYEIQTMTLSFEYCKKAIIIKQSYKKIKGGG